MEGWAPSRPRDGHLPHLPSTLLSAQTPQPLYLQLRPEKEEVPMVAAHCLRSASSWAPPCPSWWASWSNAWTESLAICPLARHRTTMMGRPGPVRSKSSGSGARQTRFRSQRCLFG